MWLNIRNHASERAAFYICCNLVPVDLSLIFLVLFEALSSCVMLGISILYIEATSVCFYRLYTSSLFLFLDFIPVAVIIAKDSSGASFAGVWMNLMMICALISGAMAHCHLYTLIELLTVYPPRICALYVFHSCYTYYSFLERVPTRDLTDVESSLMADVDDAEEADQQQRRSPLGSEYTLASISS